MELLRDLIRARALEQILGRVRTGDPSSSRPVSPGVAAIRALHTASDGTGDLFSARRGSPAAVLAMGASPRELLRQAMGRKTAPAAGRDPGGFPTDLDRGMLSPVEVPGVLVEVMAGIAVTFRLRDESRVALLVDDLQGSDAGDWHEGLSVAAARQAPLVLVSQGASKPQEAADSPPPAAPGADPSLRQGAPVPLVARAEGYGVQAHPVDGRDPRAVEKVIWQAVEAARNGRGPQVVEVATASGSPVDWLAGTLITAGSVEADQVETLRRDAAAEMDAALEAVEAEAEPDSDQVAGGNPALLRRSWCRWEGAA